MRTPVEIQDATGYIRRAGLSAILTGDAAAATNASAIVRALEWVLGDNSRDGLAGLLEERISAENVVNI